MTVPNGQLWVDPEGVTAVGDSYAEHVERYQYYLNQLASLRARYSDSWGDDDMGKQFSVKFLDGMDSLENLLREVKGNLEYAAEGLRASGKLYREADDDAAEASHKMGHTFETNFGPGGAVRANADGNQAPRGPTTIAATPRQDPVGASVGEVSSPRKRLAPPTGSTTEPAVAGAPASPEGPARPGSYLSPATSSYVAEPSYATARVNGQPVPTGYHLRAFAPFPDGNVRLDVNRYESITPVGDATVTDSEGQVLDPGDHRFFVVGNNPNVDPTAAGYQPMYLGFTAEGTAVPVTM